MHFNYNQQLDWLQQVQQHMFLLQLQPLHQSAMNQFLSSIWNILTFFNTILPKINLFQLLSKLGIVVEHYKISSNWFLTFQPISGLK